MGLLYMGLDGIASAWNRWRSARGCTPCADPTGLMALIGRGGWWARRVSEGHPYTIGNP
ncbi:MAG: hypothetical protein JO031_16580 [Ktedonobacteraceae bacterium]|nr:hypothetical protein [Ktedonobacteraceae bacterium]